MKTPSLVCIAGALALLIAPLTAGCGILDFDVDQPIPEQRIQVDLITGLLSNFLQNPFPITINLEQETKARGTGPVRAAGLKSLTFQITNTAMPSGDSDDFSFVKTVDIYVESTKQGTTLTRQKIADLPTPPGAVTQFSLHTYPDINLLPYINEGSRITSTASGNTPKDDVTFNGQILVHVNTL